jgi:hypothetical protein
MALIPTMLESFAVLRRPNIGRDSAQGITQPSFAVIATNLPCSVQELPTNEKILYAQRNTSVTTKVYFAQDPTAQINDILDVTDRTGRTSRYLVQGEAQAVGRGRVWDLDAEKIPQPGTGFV